MKIFSPKIVQNLSAQNRSKSQPQHSSTSGSQRIARGTRDAEGADRVAAEGGRRVASGRGQDRGDGGQVPILPKVTNIGLLIFVTCTFYVFVTLINKVL
jgi:hypothetical protein